MHIISWIKHFFLQKSRRKVQGSTSFASLIKNKLWNYEMLFFQFFALLKKKNMKANGKVFIMKIQTFYQRSQESPVALCMETSNLQINFHELFEKHVKWRGRYSSLFLYLYLHYNDRVFQFFSFFFIHVSAFSSIRKLFILMISHLTFLPSRVSDAFAAPAWPSAFPSPDAADTR